MSRQTPSYIHCPYWLDSSQRCSLRYGGLFIPVSEYINNFCCSGSFTLCREYIYAQQMSRQEDKEKQPNRRKFPRLDRTYAVTLEQEHQEMQLQHTLNFANTINISAGGMQIRLLKPSRSNSLIDFYFDDKHPAHLEEGQARVRWCSFDQDIMQYCAGLHFKDTSTFIHPHLS